MAEKQPDERVSPLRYLNAERNRVGMQIFSYLLIIIGQVSLLFIVVTDRVAHGIGMDKTVFVIFSIVILQILFLGYLLMSHFLDLQSIDDFYAKAREAVRK